MPVPEPRGSMRARRPFPGFFLLAVLVGTLAAAVGDAKPGGFSSSGRSYSSGGRSSSFSRPSSTGRSYSSGRSMPSFSHTTPSPASRPAGKSYSSGAKTPTWAPATPSAASRPAPPSGKSYSGGAVAAPSSSRSRPFFDTAAADAQRKEESRRAYTRGKEAKPAYRDPTGESHPIDPGSRKVEELRR